MAAFAIGCLANTACLQRQRCINSHAQTQRTLAACSSNINGPAACAAGCFEVQSHQRWETARTAPRETCPCSCRSTTACATACEWKKNELLHHSRFNEVALLLCVLMCAVQYLSDAPFALAGVELRRVHVSKKNQNAQPCTAPTAHSMTCLFSTQPQRAPPLHAIGSATIAHVFIFFLHRATVTT